MCYTSSSTENVSNLQKNGNTVNNKCIYLITVNPEALLLRDDAQRT